MEESSGAFLADSSDGSLSRPPKVRRIGKPKPAWFLVPEKKGRRLMELFSVRFVNYEPEKLAEIYGIIMFNCSGKPYVLFERLPGDPLPVDCNGFVKLTGPNKVHGAYDRIEFHDFLSNLKGCYSNSCHTVWYGVLDECLLDCNKLLFKRWDTMIGPIELGFAVFTESVAAALEVNLLDWKDNGKSNGRITGPVDEIEVFGEITSHVKMISDPRAKSYMFKREKDECALVKPGQAIPLSRCYTACPIESSIELHLALYHPNSGFDDLILDDHVEVPAINRGDEFVLESDCARIQLKVTFTK